MNQSQANNATIATTNAVQSNVVRPLRNLAPKINLTPFGEPIDATLNKLIQTNMITFLEAIPYDPGPFKSSWWNDNNFCDCHCSKGHKTYSCYKLKNLIQDLIDQGDVILDTDKGLSN